MSLLLRGTGRATCPAVRPRPGNDSELGCLTNDKVEVPEVSTQFPRRLSFGKTAWAATLGALLLALAAAAPAGATWTSPRYLNSAFIPAELPAQVGMDADGDSYMVFADGSGRVQMKKFSPTGAPLGTATLTPRRGRHPRSGQDLPRHRPVRGRGRAPRGRGRRRRRRDRRLDPGRGHRRR